MTPSTPRRPARRTVSARVSALVPTLVLVLCVAGCRGGEDTPDDVSPEQAREDTRSAAVEVVGLVEAEDAAVAESGGAYGSCGGGPDPQVEYRAGAELRADGDAAEVVDRAEDALTDAGWSVESSERGDRPRVVTSRDALTATVESAKFEEGRVIVSVQHECVADDEDVDRDFDTEPLDVG